MHTCRVDQFPFCADESLQYIVATKKIKKTTGGVVKSFYIKDTALKDVRYYDERFRNGTDLQAREHERPLPEEVVYDR